MAKRLTFDPGAKLEIREAALYYEEARVGLGEEFLQAVENAIRNLFNNPLRWRLVKDPFRRCIVHRFPYAVIFSADDYEVFIAAVMHQKRKPDYWIDRIPKR